MSVERVRFVRDGISYTFYADSRLGIYNKKIYFGRFEDRAPVGLVVGREYCLKEVRAKNPRWTSHAADRECYDLLDYKGAHLRQILLRDDAAEEVKAWLEGGWIWNWTDEILCKVIEPRYESAEDLFQDAALLTVRERLDVVRQYALGAKELQDTRVAGLQVKAHRDLKVANGVKEIREDGEIRIRLVDFASILLREDAEETMFATTHGSGTAKLPMSRESTAPELLVGPRELVSEKVDVYALGFLLASLFVRRNGEYVNPINIWSEQLGWRDLDLDELKNKLREEFARSKEAYESDFRAKTSWVEQALAQKGVTLSWEDVANDVLQGKIRELFVKATRLDPGKRPSLNAFISRLEKLIGEIDADAYGALRCPTAVYLFHREDAANYREIYQKAAVEQFRKDADEFAQMGFSSYRALCISYSGREYAQEDMEGCVDLLKYPYPCATEEELASAVGTLTTKNSRDKNCLLFGLFGAYRFFCENRKTFYFPDGMGKIYLFSPTLPAKKDIEPFLYQGEELDLTAFCELTFENFCRSGVEIKAFVERSAAGDKLPVVCVYLRDLQAEPASGQKADKKNHANAVPGGAGIPENFGETDSKPEVDGEYLTEGAALFVETRSGDRRYVGQVGR